VVPFEGGTYVCTRLSDTLISLVEEIVMYGRMKHAQMFFIPDPRVSPGSAFLQYLFCK